MSKVNFRELLADVMNGSSEDVEFCIKFAEEQQAKGLTDVEITSDILRHLAVQSNHEKTRKVVDLNQTISKSIETLKDMGCWPQLGGVAKHALESEIECLTKEGKPFSDLNNGNKIRLAVLRMGSDDFKNVFTKEFLDKMSFLP